MDVELRSFYIKYLLVPVGIYLIFEILFIFNPEYFSSFSIQSNILPIVIFVGSATTGLGLTIFYRSYFANLNRSRNSISRNYFNKFEKNLIILSLLPVYFALFGVLQKIPEFYQYFSILVALYAAYYYYPSSKRLELDRRIFRVEVK
jgi:hypothetical protein